MVVVSTRTKRVMGLTGATATVAAAVAVGFSGASQAEEPEPAPPGPVTTSEMTLVEPTVDPGASAAPDSPEVATPPVTATTPEAP